MKNLFLQKTNSMKKLYSALLALLLLATVPALAQKGLYFGIAGSVQSTWITNQNNYGLPPLDYARTFGGSVNVNIGYDFIKQLGIKIEIGYGQFGQKYTKTIDDSAYTRQVKLNYLMIPVMLKYRTGGAIAKFYVAIGPQFNMLLSANQSYLVDGNTFMDTVKTLSGKPFAIGQSGIKDRFASMDIFARLDFGVDITLIKHLMIEVGIKLGYGLDDLNATDYRLKDNTGNYHASHDLAGGLTIGINYRL
jgi:hypothetical protein